MKKQTAIEWLEERMPTVFKNLTINKHLFEQAKEMEKEQRIADYYKGACDESDSHGAQYICESDAEKWYNETKQNNLLNNKQNV